jgi:hypothetical protein
MSYLATLEIVPLAERFACLCRGSSRRGRRVRRPQRPDGQRGQALLEFASFLVIILFLIAGVVDVGGLLNDHVTIEYATRQGARTGAVLGSQPVADCAIISAVNSAVANDTALTITQIVIYNAGPDGQPQGLPSESVYAGDPTCTISNGTASVSEVASPNNYPPSVRNNNPYVEDSLGVMVTYNYAFQFPLLGSGVFQATDYTVMPMNPIVLPTPQMAPTPTTG